MPLYQYQARNNKGKLLKGILDAENERRAKDQIQALGLEFLSMDTLPQNPLGSPQNPLPIYEYEAYDKKNRKIIGTLPAKNPFLAIQRLQNEYDLEVSFVVPKGASLAEKETAKQKSLEDYRFEHEKNIEKELNIKHHPSLQALNIMPQTESYKAIPKESLASHTPSPVAIPRPNQGLTLQSDIPPSASRHNSLAKDNAIETNQEHIVDPVLKVVKQGLAKFGPSLSSEQNKKYQQWIEKLLRLKKNTQTEEVYRISKEILSEIQHLEIQLHQQELQAKKDALKKKMMEQLKKVSASELKEAKPGYQRSKAILWFFIHHQVPFLKPLALWILHRIPSDKELALIEEERTLNEKIFLLQKRFQGAEEQDKKGIQDSLERLDVNKKDIQERRRLIRLQIEKNRSGQSFIVQAQDQQQIQNGFWNLQKAQDQEESSENPSFELLYEIRQMSAWLLSFYMVLYFLHFYHQEKGLWQGFFLAEMPLFEAPSFQALTLGLFFSYVLLELHHKNFPNKPIYLFWMTPLFAFFFLLLIVNL